MYNFDLKKYESRPWNVVHLFTYLRQFSDEFYIASQISEQANMIFDETMRQDRLPINMSVPSEPLLLPAYIEDCSI